MTEFVIKNHRLEGVNFIASPNVGGALDPRLLVTHYTAGYDDDGAIATFQNKASKVSAHLIIDRDATVTQMVPFNKVAWHAGPSRYKGFQGINSYGIGFEFDNIGYVKKTADGRYVDYRGKLFTPDEGQTLIAEKEPRIGGDVYYWPSYTQGQIDAGLAIARALIAKYPTIEDVVSHEEIDTRGWKTDPGPAFPQQLFKNLFRNEQTESTVKGGEAKAEVTASILNVRSGAGPQWDKFAQVTRGSIVTITAQVGDWSYITFDNNRTGWVASQYLSRL
jgi:N-acetylmuramoyl-L-alanine amidase